MPGPSSSKPKKLLDQLRDAIRIKHYSYSTEKNMSIGQSATFSFITSVTLPKWAHWLPQAHANPRVFLDEIEYVHWYDCISNYGIGVNL